MSAQDSEVCQTVPDPESELELSREPMLYCPVCSTYLQQSRCKLVCERCGYFMSCADYY